MYLKDRFRKTLEPITAAQETKTVRLMERCRTKIAESLPHDLRYHLDLELPSTNPYMLTLQACLGLYRPGLGGNALSLLCDLSLGQTTTETVSNE